MYTLWHQYLFNDFWVPVWPNIAASILWAVPAFVWHKRKVAAKIEEQTVALMQHHENMVKDLLANKS